jgi:tRNA-splicing ligase RtcB
MSPTDEPVKRGSAPGSNRRVVGGVTLVEESDCRWRIDQQGAMRVPGVVFAAPELLPELGDDRALEQVRNVATLPGVVEASYAMPDVHWGYGFPIGGVAATDVETGGVVSPGGVGFDISCGVRVLTSNLLRDDIAARIPDLMDDLGRCIPKGMGPGAVWDLADDRALRDVLVGGAVHVVGSGRGEHRDLERCEDGGRLPGADPGVVSDRAVARGLHQLGSLGSGNHFLELQCVDRVIDGDAAATLGLHPGQVCVMIHSGSRGLGHQICTDHVRLMSKAMERYDIDVPDRQLACVPVESPEGEAYMAAMAAAANYGRANRQMLTVAVRAAFERVLGVSDLDLLYDVSHNLAKIETHEVRGRSRRLCVHRKGATRALPPGHPDLPPDLAQVGQPVLVPGSMGTSSYVLVGMSGSAAFHSSCHGAGRVMSRTAARKQSSGRQVAADLAALGIEVRAGSSRGLVEEAPFSYKDVDLVVESVARAGLARPVVRLVPLGVVKG